MSPWCGCEDEPSGPTTRPFSLRGVVPGPRMDVEVDWPYRYCEDRQVAFVHGDDGSAVPLLKHTKPGRPRWAMAVSVPSCRYDLESEDYLARQTGPRRLWDEAAAAHRWWDQHGKPGIEDWQWTITPHWQRINLA